MGEPTQTSNMTWTHHEPSSNIKAGRASQACCEGGNGLKTHFHRLRDTFACHYTEIAAWPNQKWFFKTGFLPAPYMKWNIWPAGSSSDSDSTAHSSPARGLKTVTCYCLPSWYFQWGSEIHTGDLREENKETSYKQTLLLLGHVFAEGPGELWSKHTTSHSSQQVSVCGQKLCSLALTFVSSAL